MTLEELNAGSPPIAVQTLRQCCGSRVWAERIVAQRPFVDKNALTSTADRVWFSLDPTDWLEAFASHPKIGENSRAKWSSEEQSGMRRATADSVAQLNRLNIDYERKFGWMFIVCATGKSAEDMLRELTCRLNNDSKTEIAIAAAEQAKITKLRLEKLLDE